MCTAHESTSSRNSNATRHDLGGSTNHLWGRYQATHYKVSILGGSDFGELPFGHDTLGLWLHCPCRKEAKASQEALRTSLALELKQEMAAASAWALL